MTDRVTRTMNRTAVIGEMIASNTFSSDGGDVLFRLAIFHTGEKYRRGSSTLKPENKEVDSC